MEYGTLRPPPMDIPKEDITALIRDKYNGNHDADISADLARLQAGEPLAYVIGWIPFLGISLDLSTRPLIPRPETEWWTEELIKELKKRQTAKVLDLCAGSGAIGLAVLAQVPNAEVSFGEITLAHTELIRANLSHNGLDASRAHIRHGNLFTPFYQQRFDIIATNPPYIPEGRALEASLAYEPNEALYAGSDGLSVIRRIAAEAAEHLAPKGELWMECDTENIDEAYELVLTGGARRAEIRTDQYGRQRIVVGYYP